MSWSGQESLRNRAGGTVMLRPGAMFVFDGEVAEVVQLEGTRVTLRDAAGGWRTLRVADFLARAASLEAAQPAHAVDNGGGPRDGAASGGGAPGEWLPVGTVLAALSQDERAQVAERADHVREVLTGFRSGSPQKARSGEPRPEYSPARSLGERYAAKAAELEVGARTIRRWVHGYRGSGEAGLVDARRVSGRSSTIDPQWEQAVRAVLAKLVPASTPTAGAVLAQVDALLKEPYEQGEVRRPSTATAYRHLARLTNGTGALSGSAKARRSIAARPTGVYGRLRAMRPGEYVVLDTQDLDVFAMEPVTCRWVPVQLTVAQDLFSRCIVGMRVTAVSTKAVDVAGVLYQAVAPSPAPAEWPAEACWPQHGVPEHLVFTEHLPGAEPVDERTSAAGLAAGTAGPVCPPETLVVDHGKAFLSAHVIGVCTRLGISIQPAQPAKPTDKPTVERFFRTLRQGLIQYLPAYKGPDVYSRGEHVEDQAFLYLHELEDVIREWIALVHHRSRQDGLVIAEWPGLGLSPKEMFEIGIAKAGMLRVPATPQLVYDFLPVHPRTIQHYGVEIGGLRYNGAALDPYRGAPSPYGGTLAGKWPIRVNPDDVRHAYFQDPADGGWHALDWEHAPGLGTPFSVEAAQHARRLAAATNRWPDPTQALAELLSRWEGGMVTDRRERRMAVRLGAERAALPIPAAAAEDPADQVAALPSVAALTSASTSTAEEDGRPGTGVTRLHVVTGDGSCDQHGDPAADTEVVGDDDDAEEIFDDVGAHGGGHIGEDFYADAFEVIE